MKLLDTYEKVQLPLAVHFVIKLAFRLKTFHE